MKHYKERDIEALDDYYTRHVSAMTAEALHSKSAIAAELGFRDAELDRFRARIAEVEGALKEAVDHLEYCGYGDSWERSCAFEARLPERLKAALSGKEGK